jgi:acylphosphatase
MANKVEIHRVHVKINGRVQGVYYRASALQEAQKLGLMGWVMNCSDGSVEALAEGEKPKLEQFIGWCRQGPDGARVASVDLRWATAEHNFHGFIIRRQ